jgi:hypothetical protein
VESEPPVGRVQRVPYKEAEDLVGEKALAAVASDKTRRYDWGPHGVPPERLCGLLIRAIYAGRLTAPEPDTALIQLLRDIAKRSGEKGPAWELVTQALNLAWRDLKRGGSR